MGILRGALNGLGKGLVQKAAIDWDRIKTESEVESRKALMEIENTNSNARLDREIAAGDARQERDVTARKELSDAELGARSKEGTADRQSREKIASEGNAAAIQAAGLRAAGRSGSKIIGYDAEGNPIYGADDGDFKSSIVKEPLMRVERGPDGKLREVPVLDENNQPVMRERLVKFSGKTGADYRDDDDGVDVPDDQLEALNAKPASAAPTSGAAPAAAAAPASGGVLKQAEAAQRDPMKNVTDPIRESADLEKQIAGVQQVMQGVKDEKAMGALQQRLSDLIRRKNELAAARGY